MWTLLQAFGLNKWMAYGAIALTLAITAATIVIRIRAAGAQSERAAQLQASLKNLQQEVRERARIEAMRTLDARQQLRDRWSAH